MMMNNGLGAMWQEEILASFNPLHTTAGVLTLK
jgi:hypothetical protein